jgi:tRNA1Val (adenine37-N6)-methyltransferase
MAADIFKFKYFDVDQSGCAMRVNTDGVLLGALAQANNPQRILDIGTGTGVIALMLAQRFVNAHVDAVEIDVDAAETADRNFTLSPYSNRVTAYAQCFETFFAQHIGKRFDLIVSNPPFFLNSLKSSGIKRTLAKHTDESFYASLVKCLTMHLTEKGTCQLVLPNATAGLVKDLIARYHFYLTQIIHIKSFADSAPHRQIITFGKEQRQTTVRELCIYSKQKIYALEYQMLLANFLTIFNT